MIVLLCCRFINTKHHAGHWLDYVKSLEHIDIKLDDHIGLRRTKKVINVLGNRNKIQCSFVLNSYS